MSIPSAITNQHPLDGGINYSGTKNLWRTAGDISLLKRTVFLLSAEGWHSTRSNHVTERFNYGMRQR